MPQKLSESIDSIRQASAKLNQITDKAAEAVREVEDFLNRECSLGIPASIRVSTESFDDGDEYGYSIETGLHYCRIGNRYRIGIYTVSDMDPSGWDVKPWSDCSREDKLLTIESIPALMHELSEAVTQKIKSAEEATKTVNELLDSLRQGKEG